MYIKQERGKIGEELAVRYLIQNRYKIIDRNFYGRKGEIDIIAKDLEKTEIVFIEVKTRSNNHYGKPSEAVNRYKMKHIYDTAQYYIYLKKLEKQFIRFDAIEVYIKQKERKYKINHIRNMEI